MIFCAVVQRNDFVSSLLFNLIHLPLLLVNKADHKRSITSVDLKYCIVCKIYYNILALCTFAVADHIVAASVLRHTLVMT